MGRNLSFTLLTNSANGTDKITEASWNSLVNLCVDICRRHDFRLTYDGTKNGSLTRHNMYANTSCPGNYLQSRLPELARIAFKTGFVKYSGGVK